jgi:hypothetical protein
MIERVARAICNSLAGGDFDSLPEWGPLKNTYRGQARAAIEAMRDPSWEMMGAMYEAMFADKWDGSQAPMVGAGFDAAIDAALASPPTEREESE